MNKDRQIKRECPDCKREQGFLINSELDEELLRSAVSNENFRIIMSRLEIGAPSSAYNIWLDVMEKGEQMEKIIINQQLLSKIHSVSSQSFFKSQLVALERIPLVHCESCTTIFCLGCGSKAHTNACIDNYIAEFNKDNRPCPRCFAIINRDSDGCNEMQCEVCGKTFCWQCLKPWSQACGIYRCTNPIFSTTDPHQAVNKSEAKKLNKRNQDTPAWELYDRIKGKQ